MSSLLEALTSGILTKGNTPKLRWNSRGVGLLFSTKNLQYLCNKARYDQDCVVSRVISFLFFILFNFILFLAPKVIHSRGLYILRKNETCLERSRCGLRNIGNVSARQAAVNRWTATDKRWKKKNGFSRVSRHLSQTPSDLRQELLSSGTLFIYS